MGLDVTEGKSVSQEKGEKTNPKQNFREGRKEEKKNPIPCPMELTGGKLALQCVCLLSE